MGCGHRTSLVSAALATLLAACAVLAGCGNSGSQESGPTGTSARSEAPGVKGERAGREAATRLHLSRADCAALAAQVRSRSGAKLRRRSEPSPPLSRCQLSGPGVAVNLYLDTAYAAHQRYENRMVEQAQFGAPETAKLPHPVAGVGEPGSHGGSANWVPGYNSLFAVRGNRWLTVAYSVAGLPNRHLRAGAAALARTAFRLSAR